MTTKKMLVLPGDGIGPAIVAQALKVCRALRDRDGLCLDYEEGLIGGAAIDATGDPLPEATLSAARAADVVLLGAVGGPKWEPLDISVRPERGLLRIRAGLELFANLRPAILYPQLAAASTLKPEVVAGLDIMIVRELTGGIYFGEPRGVRRLASGERQGYNTEVYSEGEIRRVAHTAFELALKRSRRLCSIDKANVLECTELWRNVVEEVGCEYPQVALSHMYVDNCAMQLVRAPKQFDVIVTNNMFGDILSDLASMLTGSIGMLPSASLDEQGKGMYEPIHGSAPDIAGRDLANPIATVLSLAMALRYTLNEPGLAARVEQAVGRVLDQGLRTADIMSDGMRKLGTEAMGDAIVAAL
ncbi:MAG: 3-isopropylmalate dehydrogenase [Gammaproteobacteria bacterium]|nr:3-isopropylmalate dehydrogenase [Gammaproteobacteria bacterium]